MNKTAVRNSCFIGRIESDSYNESFIGGIAGIARNSSVSSACFSGQIDIADTAPHAGGIVGHMDGSRIENSYAKGSVASSANSVTVGGIAGSMEGSSTIALSYTVMTMQATGFKVNIGGIAGAAELSTIKNCTVLGSSLTGDQSGRIAGNVDTVTFIDNYAISSMVIVGSTGGFIKGTDTKQGADVSTANESFFKDILMWDFTRIWKMPYGQTYPTLEWQTAAP